MESEKEVKENGIMPKCHELVFREDDYVKIVATNGDYRYGYVSKVIELEDSVLICMENEGESKIEYDAASNSVTPREYLDHGEKLTDAEKRVILLISDGLSTNEIASTLSISPVTVRSHIRTLKIKFHLDNRAQLITYSKGIQGKHPEMVL